MKCWDILNYDTSILSINYKYTILPHIIPQGQGIKTRKVAGQRVIINFLGHFCSDSFGIIDY